MKKYIFSTLLVFVFSACSNKQYFEPKNTNGNLNISSITMPSFIASTNSNGATLENNMIIDTVGITKHKLPTGYSFLNNINGTVLAVNKSKELLIVNTNETIKFKENIIAASISGDILALVFANNSIGLYDNKEKQFKLKEYFKHSFLNDNRIAMPLFLNKIILIPTLDGKVIIINKLQNKIIKTLNVDLESEIRNIILLKVVNNVLIAASSNKIITLKNSSIKKEEFFIQSYIIDDNNIYIASLDGTIYKYDLELNLLAKKKFRFAKFQALAISEYLYAIESQGFIVKLSKNLKESKIYTYPFEEDEKLFSSKNKLYFENKLLLLK
jgi:hypothetical protein